MVYTRDSKSRAVRLESSSLSPGTKTLRVQSTPLNFLCFCMRETRRRAPQFPVSRPDGARVVGRSEEQGDERALDLVSLPALQQISPMRNYWAYLFVAAEFPNSYSATGCSLRAPLNQTEGHMSDKTSGTEAMCLKYVAATDALRRDGHYVGKSGVHLPDYFNKDKVTQSPHMVSGIARFVASHFTRAGVTWVVAPEMGAIILGNWVAYHLTEALGATVRSVYAEKTADDGLWFNPKRGWDPAELSGHNVLCVEDVLTTGGTAEKLVALVRKYGGNVIGLGCIWNRGGVEAPVVGAPMIYAPINLLLPSYAESECPMCAAGVPVNEDLGHGKAYVAAKRAAAKI